MHENRTAADTLAGYLAWTADAPVDSLLWVEEVAAMLLDEVPGLEQDSATFGVMFDALLEGAAVDTVGA